MGNNDEPLLTCRLALPLNEVLVDGRQPVPQLRYTYSMASDWSPSHRTCLPEGWETCSSFSRLMVLWLLLQLQTAYGFVPCFRTVQRSTFWHCIHQMSPQERWRCFHRWLVWPHRVLNVWCFYDDLLHIKPAVLAGHFIPMCGDRLCISGAPRTTGRSLAGHEEGLQCT